jgi:hypothetical protein
MRVNPWLKHKSKELTLESEVVCKIYVLITLWVLQYVFTFENPNDDPKPVKCSIYSICINMKLRWNFLDQFW